MSKDPSHTRSTPRKLKTFSLDQQVIQQITKIASDENRSVSNTVETALKQWANERNKVSLL